MWTSFVIVTVRPFDLAEDFPPLLRNTVKVFEFFKDLVIFRIENGC